MSEVVPIARRTEQGVVVHVTAASGDRCRVVLAEREAVALTEVLTRALGYPPESRYADLLSQLRSLRWRLSRQREAYERELRRHGVDPGVLRALRDRLHR